jgi:ssRNA-specific RNase YbeY (16S rRNA maturation enzyme)
MKSISSTYKNEDVALPVLSFPIRDNSNPEKEFIGEVFICYPQAILLAAERNKRVDDLMTELVEHGVRNLLK